MIFLIQGCFPWVTHAKGKNKISKSLCCDLCSLKAALCCFANKQVYYAMFAVVRASKLCGQKPEINIILLHFL